MVCCTSCLHHFFLHSQYPSRRSASNTNKNSRRCEANANLLSNRWRDLRDLRCESWHWQHEVDRVERFDSKHGGCSKRADSPSWWVVKVPSARYQQIYNEKSVPKTLNELQPVFFDHVFSLFLIVFAWSGDTEFWGFWILTAFGMFSTVFFRRLQGIRLQSGSIVPLDSKELEALRSGEVDEQKTTNNDTKIYFTNASA